MTHERPPGRSIIGRNPVLEALKAGTAISRIVLMNTAEGSVIQEIKSFARRQGIQVQEMPKQEFVGFARDEKAQGVVALAAEQQTLDLSTLISHSKTRQESGFIILPDQIEDPGNLGALIRTAECAGAHGLVLTKHHSASLSSGAIKASAGATEHLRIAVVSNLVNAILELKENGFWIVGLEMAGERMYTEVDYSGSTAIVVGSERRGIRRLVREHCDFLVRIPILGKISSLNASVAGALLMYEVRRQRTPAHG